MPKLAEYYSEISLRGVSGVMRGLDRVRSGFASLAGIATAPIRSIGGLLGGLASPAGLVGAALGAAGVAGGAGILRLASGAESLDTQFRVLLGSGEAAASMMADINKFAATTPFEQMELAAAAKQLLAFGEAQGDVIPRLRQLGDIAALSGARLEDLVPIYGKVRAQGKLTAETLDQFQSRGIPIVGELAKEFGIAETQIREMVSSGQVGFAEVQAAITALISEGGRFGGGMEQLAQTTGGLWSTVTGNFKTLLASFGASIIQAFDLKSVLAGLGEWLGNLAANFQTIAGPVIAWFSTAMARAADGIRAVWSAVSDWFANLWARWGGVITQYIATLIAAFQAASEIIFTVFRAVFDFVSSVFQRLVSVIGSWFGLTEGDLAQWLENWLAGLQFVSENWRLYFAIIAERVLLFFANMIARMQALGTNFVRVIVWIWNNWRDIFATIANFASTVFQNLMANLRSLWQGFWKFLKSGRWEVDWTPLTQGFESAIREMPQLVAANVAETTPALERLRGELEARRREFEKRRTEKGRPAATEAEAVPETHVPATGLPAAPSGSPTAAAPAAPVRAAGGAGIAFTGLAALANQMQEEAGKRLQEQTAAATKRTADGVDRLAAAADGGALRVKIAGDLSPRYA